MRFKNMFAPIQIGPMLVPNRFVVPPMCNNYALPDGNMSERSIAYYRERARGGFGLIVAEATVVDRAAKGGPRKHCLFDDSQIKGLRKMVAECHACGAKVSVQLQHAGPEGNARAAGFPIKSASRISAGPGRDIPDEITTDELYALIERYGDAAVRARTAGADAVEVHCAHGYLVSSFLSPQTNKRVDEFGGSFENRMRLPRLIIENIRKKVGHSIALLCRINSSDEVAGGLDLRDNALIAAYLESCGVDGLNVSRSVHIRDEYMWAPTVLHAGFNLDHITEIKKAVSIPVITIGRFTDPYLPDLLVGEGRCDLVAFGRQSIADPWLPNKAASDTLEDLNPCIACLQGCVHNMFQGKPITCLVNPLVGREAECDLCPAKDPKKIVVVGGGVGGMYAATVLARKGHRVSLYEATDRLGGQMRLAAIPPGKGDLTNMVRSYIVALAKSGCTVHMNAPVDEALLAREKANVVILATGGRPLRLPIPGIDSSSLMDAVDVLDGKAAPGRKVLVVGGGMVGSETADFLGERGFKVTVIELREDVAADVISEHRLFLMQSFAKNGVEVVCNAKVREFMPGGVAYETVSGETRELSGFDSVVLAMGTQAYNPLEKAARGLADEVHVIGDAMKARRALDATYDALEAVLAIQASEGKCACEETREMTAELASI